MEGWKKGDGSTERERRDNELAKEEKKRENECRIWKRICLEKQRYEREKGKEDKGKDGNDPDDAEKLNETKKKTIMAEKKERKKVDRKFIPRINETKSFVLQLGQVKCQLLDKHSTAGGKN
ncbi:hypothetical protein RUM43_002402 [Polyplax serrata]|uniref:Uncharacterized protein n=1 Tax=Polyplax serrata TaxID=468196 RepID=A0AAN8PMB1_POLSC